MYSIISKTVTAFLCFVFIFISFQTLSLWEQKFAFRLSNTVLYTSSRWRFDTHRDSNDFYLSNDQCDAAFPLLYQEVDRSVEYWTRNGRVLPENVDISGFWLGALRVRISNRQLYILEARNATQDAGLRSRTIATLHQIQQAAYGMPHDAPDVEFSFVTDDRPYDHGSFSHDKEVAVWTYARQVTNPDHDSLWLMPDFNFWYWEPVGGFLEYQEAVREMDSKITDKIPKIVWRGATWTNPEIRQALVNVSRDKPWSDVESMRWQGDKMSDNAISMTNHCRYAMNAHTEGRSWSGRLKYLLNCHAVTMVHDLEWTAAYYPLLSDAGPTQNIVRVHRDFTNLEENVQNLLSNPVEAQRIADNAASMFRDRYLTPAASACYWRKMFTAWASVSFIPARFETVPMVNDNGDRLAGSTAGKRTRGVPFEEYIIRLGNYPWEEHK